MEKLKAVGMEHKPGGPPYRPILAIEGIPQDGVPGMVQVDPDLVPSPGKGLHLQVGGRIGDFEGPEAGLAGFTLGVHPHPA
jgi:hypothetical protein